MRIPVIHPDRVFHVGTMNPAKVGSNGASQEGHCLSVSPCPNSWTEIARLGGNKAHRLVREGGGAFLDAHAVLDDAGTLEAAVDWAVSEGLAERVELWKSWRTDEDGEWSYMTHASRDAAFDEVNYDDDYDDPDDVEGPDGGPGIEPFDAVVGTPALAAATGVRHDPESDATDAVLMAWARSVASELVDGGLDGVWWRETHDPEALSAPRAAMFPERVGGWTHKAVRAASVDDEAEIDRIPEAVVHEVADAPAPR